MARPLPRFLRTGSAPIARSREAARSAADSAADVLHPLITVARGLRRLAGAGRRRWADTPRDGRGGLLFLAASVVLVVALVPYGPPLAVVVLMAAAAWHGRDRASAAPAGPDPARARRLASLYEALVPYFAVPGEPGEGTAEPRYAHGGCWERAFGAFAFDDDGRLTRLLVRYPASFTDGEAASRARVEHVLRTKSGRGREYRFDWDEEGNELTVTALDPLATDITAQRFVTAPGELVLGFTDPGAVPRTVPVRTEGGVRDEPPVVWRTGPRSTAPHLLAVGGPGSGTTGLLRSLALQALRDGDVLLVEGTGAGEFAALAGRPGVLDVEYGLGGALAGLERAARETERRLVAAQEARRAGVPLPKDVRRPLYVFVDRPSVLAHLAEREGSTAPRSLLQVPLRHGRAAGVTVVVAEQDDALDALPDVLLQYARARVTLGPVGEDTVRVLGAAPRTAPVTTVPPGRGYARLGDGPVLRLQVPATPDPYDDTAPEEGRAAVLALLADREAERAAAPGTESGPDTESLAVRQVRDASSALPGTVAVEG
ncbi:hypothetical protein [Streptomyces sp. NPDC049906]|uniref:hypothetical protein n=1 Tax=Streptomyces sp. NPDC049906 TaxID=3155656 RepID=UPI00341F3C91